MSSSPHSSWLPPHHEHILYTAAHIDASITRLAEITHTYLAGDPLKLAPMYSDATEEIVLIGVAPLPQAVPRLFADALNAARNMLEHALFAEVNMRLDRPLTAQESRALEVPATDTEEKFIEWMNHRHRKSIGLFEPASELSERLKRLQPFHRRDVDAHPLRVIVEHTNYAKHREPTVSVTRVGRVDVDNERRDTRVAEHQDMVEIGAILASVPRGTQTGVSIWPQIMVQRPHTGLWRTLMHELRDLEEWAREQALPIIVAGRTDLPPVPPHLDISMGYETAGDAWGAASSIAAAHRATARMAGEGIRRDLLDTLVGRHGPATRAQFGTWLAGFSEGEVLTMFTLLAAAAAAGDPVTVADTIDNWTKAAGVVSADS